MPALPVTEPTHSSSFQPVERVILLVRHDPFYSFEHYPHLDSGIIVG
jgi:hypothetical protein